ncbi:MAG TPA: NfeD family protein [Desulfosalsimonadaceae bacterium]|nr:NfeD family protein [Desulfosalsimonadaceae bacterium]
MQVRHIFQRFCQMPILVAVLSLFFAVTIHAQNEASQPQGRPVFVIPVSGTVDPGMAAFLERACQEAAQSSNSLVVLEIDTFGGRVDSALEIVDTLLTIPPERSIAFVKKKAISAGALIALSCGDLAMRPATTIGDTAPIVYSQEGPKMMGEKFQSPIRAKFRALARRNGYPEALAEAMVTPEKIVYAVEIDGKKRYMDAQAFDDLTQEEKERVTNKTTVVEKGELLTLSAAEAFELGFSSMTVSGIDAMLEKRGSGPFVRSRIAPSWSETMVRYIGSIAPILMMIGLAALYMEMKAPGFGIPGLVGLACLGIVFLNQYMVGLADYTELLIIVLGLVLMGVEVFVLPGFGVAGFAGIVCIIIGLILTFQDFVIPDPNIPWETEILLNNVIKVVGAYVVSFILGLFFIRYVLPRLSTATEGPYLTSSLKGAHSDSRETSRVHVGDTGVAMTALRPSGKVKIGADVFDVVTENEFIERNAPVMVSEIAGNRVIVARNISE